MQIPMITAHSGCENTSRDSIDSIYEALKYDPDAVEIDVRMSDDGVLRISHDAIMECDYPSKLSLEEIFSLISKTDMQLNCDLKNSSALYGVLDMAARFGFDSGRLILSGCLSPEQLVRDVSIMNKATIYLNIEEVFKFLYLFESKLASTEEFVHLMNKPWDLIRKAPVNLDWFQRAARFAYDLNVCTVNLPHRYVNDETIALFSKASVPISVWTVNDPAQIDYYLRKNVLNITTLNVAEACKQRRSIFHGGSRQS